MTLNVELDNESFAKAITEGIQAIPKEEMAEICKECIKQYILKDEKIERMFFSKSGWGSDAKLVPTNYLENLIMYGFTNEELESVRKEILNIVDREKRTIIMDCLVKAFANTLVTDSFVSGIQNSIEHCLVQSGTNESRINNIESRLGSGI